MDAQLPCRPCMHADVGRVFVVKPRVLICFLCKRSNEEALIPPFCLLKRRKVELEFTHSQVRENSETDSNGVATSLLDLVERKPSVLTCSLNAAPNTLHLNKERNKRKDLCGRWVSESEASGSRGYAARILLMMMAVAACFLRNNGG